MRGKSWRPRTVPVIICHSMTQYEVIKSPGVLIGPDFKIILYQYLCVVAVLSPLLEHNTH